jgi:hypothetical protein
MDVDDITKDVPTVIQSLQPSPVSLLTAKPSRYNLDIPSHISSLLPAYTQPVTQFVNFRFPDSDSDALITTDIKHLFRRMEPVASVDWLLQRPLPSMSLNSHISSLVVYKGEKHVGKRPRRKNRGHSGDVRKILTKPVENLVCW